MTDKIVILSTCADEAEAEKVARALVDRHLAACVNVLPAVRSFYRWQGKIESSAECLLVVKTSRALFSSIRAVLESVHSYELPELIALPIVEGSPTYLAWLDSSLGGTGLPASPPLPGPDLSSDTGAGRASLPACPPMPEPTSGTSSDTDK